MLTYNVIFTRVAPVGQVGQHRYRVATLIGASVGIVSSILTMIFVSLMFSLLPREYLGQSAASSLSGVSSLGMFSLGVLFIPFWETFIGQLVPLELAKTIGFGEKACIVVGSTVFAAGHFLNGGLAHGASAAIGGALFSISYIAMRPWGYLPAFWASDIAHVTNNFLGLFVIAEIFPSLG